jgi:hypothetical protein
MVTAEGRTQCRRGHGIEHQRVNNRGHNICALCTRACAERKKQKKKRKFRNIRTVVIRVAPDKSSKFSGVLLNYNFPKIRFCKNGHAVIGDNFKIEGRKVLCRTCEVAKSERYRKSGNLSADTVRRVLLALEEGKSLSNIGGWEGDKYVGGRIVDLQRLNVFCDRHPKLGARIKALAATNRIQIQKQKGEQNRLVGAPAIMRNSGLDAFEAIQRATAQLWEGERSDVMSLMFIAVGEKRLKLRDAAARVGEFVAMHRRRPNVFGSYSLDTPIGEDSGMTWLDTKTDEDRLWA